MLGRLTKGSYVRIYRSGVGDARIDWPTHIADSDLPVDALTALVPTWEELNGMIVRLDAKVGPGAFRVSLYRTKVWFHCSTAYLIPLGALELLAVEVEE